MDVTFEFRKIHPYSVVPYKKNPTDAGYDLTSVEDVTLWPGAVTNVNLGIQISPPEGWYFTIEGRSSLAQRGVQPFSGIIDTGYTGPVSLLMLNHSASPVFIEKGDRVAQLLPHRLSTVEFTEVKQFSDTHSQRGDAGFGSTGK